MMTDLETISTLGFEELRAYDEDNNAWIDENDSIFDSLQVWLKNQDNDEKELVALGEVGIGAIFLNSQQSEFTYKTEMNQTAVEQPDSSRSLTAEELDRKNTEQMQREQQKLAQELARQQQEYKERELEIQRQQAAERQR